MHILFLTDNFPPETNAPANRTWEHARRWVAAGHQVTVMTSVPNYPKGIVFDGYRNRLLQREELDGIRVVRVWTYMAANEGFFKRTMDQASYLFSSAFASLLVRRPDVVIATSPQFFAAVAGWIVGILKRRPFVFELRDLWPETITAVNAVRNRLILQCLEGTARFLYRHAALMVPVTESFRHHLLDLGIPESKICVVTNGIDAETLRPLQSRRQTLTQYGVPEDRFIVGYIGTLGMCQRLGTLLEAARLLREDRGIHFVIMGEGAEKAQLERAALLRQLDNITFIPGQPRPAAIEMLAAIDVSLVLLRKSPLFQTVIPSKIFESMALGKPILLGVEGESQRIVVHRCRSGLAFPPEDAPALAQRVAELKKDPDLRAKLGAQGRQSVQVHYRRQVLADRMLGALLQVASAADSGGGSSLNPCRESAPLAARRNQAA